MELGWVNTVYPHSFPQFLPFSPFLYLPDNLTLLESVMPVYYLNRYPLGVYEIDEDFYITDDFGNSVRVEDHILDIIMFS